MAGLNVVFLRKMIGKGKKYFEGRKIWLLFIVLLMILAAFRPAAGQKSINPVLIDSLEQVLAAQGMKPYPELYIQLGRAYDRIPDLKKATAAFRKALTLAQDQKDVDMMIAAYDALGWHYYKTMEISSSILNFEMELEMAEMVGMRKGMADATFGLALINSAADNKEELFRLMNHYLELADPVKDRRRISDAMRTLGEFYRVKKEYATAIDYYQKSYDNAALAGDSALMGIAINFMAWAYYEKGDLARSLEIYEQNMGLIPPQSKSQTIANIYGNMGNIYRDWERYPEAIEYYQKSIDISKEARDFFNLSWLYLDISKMYARMGDYRKAYENAQLHAIYNDSLMASNYQRKIISAQLQFEADRKARELEMLALKLQRNRYLIYVLVGALGLLIAIALIILLQIRHKSRIRLEALDRRILELTQANLRQQMNPHFIFNTLNSIQYYVFQNDRIASNHYMSKFATLIRKTLENSRHTAIPVKEELDALELYLELESLRFKEKFEWTINVDEEIDTLAFKIPTLLIQPYVENAIMHGLMHKEGKGLIRVDLSMVSDHMLCTIEDNGIGRQKSNEINREKNMHHQSLGTTITESRLKLVNELYGRQMQVTYTDLVDPEGDPSGTRVEINIPIIT